MKLLYTFLLCLVLSSLAMGQQYFSHPMFLKNRFALNPAAAGLSGGWEVGAQAGTFMQGATDSPRQAQFQINGPTSENTGMGIQVKSFQAGAFQTFVAQLSGAYQARFNDRHFLSFGLSSGLLRRSLDQSRFGVNDYVDGTDELLNSDFFNRTTFRLEAGALYQNGNLQLSLSFPQLYETQEDVNSSFAGVASYEFGFGEIAFSPLLMLNYYANQPSLIDGGVMVEWNNTVWAQVTYRNNESFNLGAGLKIKELGIGYSYNQPTGGLTDLYSGGHEILVTVNLGKKSKAAAKRMANDQNTTLTEASDNSNQTLAEVGTESEIDDLKTDIQEMKSMISKLAGEKDKANQPVPKLVSVKTSYENGGEMAKGYYVVVQACESISCARQMMKLFEEAGKIRPKVMHDQESGAYYLYTSFTEDEKEAQNISSQLQKDGYLETRVIRY